MTVAMVLGVTMEKYATTASRKDTCKPDAPILLCVLAINNNNNNRAPLKMTRQLFLHQGGWNRKNTQTQTSLCHCE